MRWQAALTTLTATLVGVPLGVIAGRWAWIAVAEALGIPPEPSTPCSPYSSSSRRPSCWPSASPGSPPAGRRTPAAEVLRSE